MMLGLILSISDELVIFSHRQMLHSLWILKALDRHVCHDGNYFHRSHLNQIHDYIESNQWDSHRLLALNSRSRTHVCAFHVAFLFCPSISLF
jgi:hypothetical protein